MKSFSNGTNLLVLKSLDSENSNYQYYNNKFQPAIQTSEDPASTRRILGLGNYLVLSAFLHSIASILSVTATCLGIPLD